MNEKKMSEKLVKVRVKQLLEDHNCWQNWPVPTGFGIPMLDCVACHQGRFFSVETKAPGEHLSPRQELTKQEIEAAGGIVFIVGEVMIPYESGVSAPSGLFKLERWLMRREDWQDGD